MRVLLTGANGFIGRHLLTALLAQGHDVVAAVRRPTEFSRVFPGLAVVAIDFNRDASPEIWLPRLAGIDAVVNCAGILNSSRRQSFEAVHQTGPQALFDACMRAGVRQVVQISAVSAEAAANTSYALTKKAADDHLATLDLDWVVLRPSLVYGSGSYGGTSLLRALAALPFIIPVPGQGRRLFQPIHMDDLAATVLRVLAAPNIRRVTIDPVGPEPLALRDILLRLRRWLGLPPGRILPISQRLVRFAARLGDVVGGGPLSTTALRQMEYGNTASVDRFTAVTGIVPQSFETALRRHPAQVQDRWHARLYFVRPILRMALAILWLGSGVVGLAAPAGDIAGLLMPVVPPAFAALLARLGCVLDLAIGAGLLVRWRPALTNAIQVAAILGYTVALTALYPALWLDPFGPLLKNLPILAAVLALAAMETDR